MPHSKIKNQLVFVIIPAYNEEEILQDTLLNLQKLKNIPKDILACDICSLVVDNNSSDQTFPIAKKYSDYVVRECRRGYGQAVHTGILEAKRHGADIVVILDADGSDNPNNIIQIIEPILLGHSDLTLGQRMKFAQNGSMTTIQKYGNRFACRLMRLVIQRKYRDLGSLRAMTIQSFEKLQMNDMNFGWNIEMQIKAAQKNFRITEIDVSYHMRKGGTSKISGNAYQAVKAGTIIIGSVWKYGILQK
jgi:glycosyltransferase involved in cell wall biosynthesis